ncbi:MAG: glucosylceramidase [Clostridia bacterium]|nr:glucosylceramidase [Clostridia bacterium]
MKAQIRQLTRLGLESQSLCMRDLTIRDEFYVINLYEEETGRVFEGLGGAATESAAHVFCQMPSDQQEKLLDLYFGGGADYRFLRVSIDSCDFSIAHYEAMSNPDDKALASFSLQHDEQEIIPFIKRAEKKAGRSLPILLSPWSPPAFMKTTGQRNRGGKLLPEYRDMWAEYICRYIEGYQAHGLTVKYVTVQNEPNATQSWDSCIYTGEEERVFVRDHLAPALKRHDLDTGIYIWDHNKERVYARALESIKDDTTGLIEGVAFHFYTGDHFKALDLVKKRLPGKKLIFTEGCMEYSRPDIGRDTWYHAMKYAHEYIGDIDHGTTMLFDWNMYLDQEGGPNHVQNFCSAPVMCDVNTKEITVNHSLKAIQLIGQTATPGSIQIASSAWHPDIETVAFLKEDGSASMLLLNRGKTPLKVKPVWRDQVAEFELAPESLTGITFEN